LGEIKIRYLPAAISRIDAGDIHLMAKLLVLVSEIAGLVTRVDPDPVVSSCRYPVDMSGCCKTMVFC
jgi:hypothetical protein